MRENRLRCPAALACLVVCLLASPSLAAMVVNGYTPQRHDRFYSGADKAFVGQPFDWSGVGNSGGASGTGTWATLISDSFFLSATHAHPGGSVTFFPTNAATGGVTYNVTGGWQIGSSDLWLGQLNRPAGAADGLASYPIYGPQSDGEYVGDEIYNYGVPHRVGRNHIDSIGNATVSGVTGRALFFDRDTFSGGAGIDETYLQPGDSGGPSFAAINGELALVGIHWAISEDPMVSVDTFVPFYVSAVQTQMAATGSTQTVTLLVPEPVCGLAAGAGLLLVRRRRRAA